MSRLPFSITSQRMAAPTLALLLCFSGCVDGPFSQMAEWNPWYTKQWQRDEERGPTFHKRFAEMRLLQSQAGILTPDEQLPYVNQLVVLVGSDSNPVIRAEAVRTLALFRNPAILPGIRQATADKDSGVRIAACRAWMRIGGEEAIPALGDRLAKDESLDVKIAAARALAEFEDRAAIESLAAALSDDDPALQYQVIRSLRTCTGRDFGGDPQAWRDYVAGLNPPPPQSPSIVERFREFF